MGGELVEDVGPPETGTSSPLASRTAPVLKPVNRILLKNDELGAVVIKTLYLSPLFVAYPFHALILKAPPVYEPLENVSVTLVLSVKMIVEFACKLKAPNV